MSRLIWGNVYPSKSTAGDIGGSGNDRQRADMARFFQQQHHQQIGGDGAAAQGNNSGGSTIAGAGCDGVGGGVPRPVNAVGALERLGNNTNNDGGGVVGGSTHAGQARGSNTLASSGRSTVTFMDNGVAPSVFDHSPYSRAFVSAWRDHRLAVEGSTANNTGRQQHRQNYLWFQGGSSADGGVGGGALSSSAAMVGAPTMSRPAPAAAGVGASSSTLFGTATAASRNASSSSLLLTAAVMGIGSFPIPADVAAELQSLQGGGGGGSGGGTHFDGSRGGASHTLNTNANAQNNMLASYSSTTEFDDLLLTPFLPAAVSPFAASGGDAVSAASAEASVAPLPPPPPPPPFIDVSKFPHLANLPTIPYSLSSTTSTAATAPGTRNTLAFPIPPHLRQIFKNDVFFLNSCDADRLVSLYILEKLIRFMGGLTVMGLGGVGRVRYVVSQHLASNKDQKVRVQPAKVAMRVLRPRAEGRVGHGGGGDDADADGEEQTPSMLAHRPRPVTMRLMDQNALASSTTGGRGGGGPPTAAAIARQNRQVANASRYVHPHFVLACAKMGRKVPSAPFQTMMVMMGDEEDDDDDADDTNGHHRHHTAAQSRTNSNKEKKKPLVFDSLDAIVPYYTTEAEAGASEEGGEGGGPPLNSFDARLRAAAAARQRKPTPTATGHPATASASIPQQKGNGSGRERRVTAGITFKRERSPPTSTVTSSHRRGNKQEVLHPRSSEVIELSPTETAQPMNAAAPARGRGAAPAPSSLPHPRRAAAGSTRNNGRGTAPLPDVMDLTFTQKQ